MVPPSKVFLYLLNEIKQGMYSEGSSYSLAFWVLRGTVYFFFEMRVGCCGCGEAMIGDGD